VFSRPDFIEKTRLFVPVYLDGDEAGAQRWGEQFRVSGYPTMLVLNADRAEMQRIAGSMDLAQYANVLDTALGDLQPVSVILDAAVAGRALSAEECHRLAYNAWALDDLDKKDYGTHAARLSKAAENCPVAAATERTRLKLFAADYAADAESDALKPGKPPSTSLAALVDETVTALGNHQLAHDAGDSLLYLGDNFFAAVKARGAKPARAFNADFSAAMDAIAGDARFAEADQLDALGRKLSAAKALSPDGKIPEGIAHAVRARLDAALAGDQIPYVRSGIINSALHIFEELADNETAYRVVQAELPKTKTPYYYKADLGSLAEELGRKDAAVDWYAQAYAEAEGEATRFQWGVLYLSSLLRLRPDDGARIREVGAQVLGELDGPGRIYRRSRMRLEKIDGELQAWNKAAKGAHADVLDTLHQRLQQTCKQIPAADPSRHSCDAFLAQT
jgi:hypothetical protein